MPNDILDNRLYEYAHHLNALNLKNCLAGMLGTGIGIAESGQISQRSPICLHASQPVILTMRTIVIWRPNKNVLYLLPLLLVLFWGPFFYFLYESLVALVFSPPPRPDLPGCFLFSEKNVLYLCFVLIMGFESGAQSRSLPSGRLNLSAVVVALTLYKAIGQLRQINSALVVILFRDGELSQTASHFILIISCFQGILNFIYLFSTSYF
jgi:hypothetical protein